MKTDKQIMTSSVSAPFPEPPAAPPLEPTFGDLVVERYEGARDAAGRFTGRGRATFAGGGVYVGSFSNGTMHGEGAYTWPSGTVYEGAFVGNEARGRGAYRWADGASYVGEVSKGLRHGKGLFVAAGGFPRYDGGWRAGRPHGEGTMTYDRDGRVAYRGAWRHGRRDGEGTMRRERRRPRSSRARAKPPRG